MDQQQLDKFIARYVSMWHEPDAARRREIVRALWDDDAENYTRTFVVRGMDEMLPKSGGPIEARGLDIFVLGTNGRIRTLYQWSEPLTALPA